jgi:hypothetical protein
MAGFFEWVAHSGVVQGFIIGGTLAFLTAILVMNAVAGAVSTTLDGWRIDRRCGQPRNGILVRAAGTKALPMVNVFEEAAYWTTTRMARGEPSVAGIGTSCVFQSGNSRPMTRSGRSP